MCDHERETKRLYKITRNGKEFSGYSMAKLGREIGVSRQRVYQLLQTGKIEESAVNMPCDLCNKEKRYGPIKIKGEIWKEIKEFPGYYASDRGRIYHTLHGYKREFRSEKIDKYQTIGIGGKYYYAHRLILEAFQPKENEGDVVNHKDGIRSNNILSNLEWVSMKENVHHAITVLSRHGSLWQRNKARKSRG